MISLPSTIGFLIAMYVVIAVVSAVINAVKKQNQQDSAKPKPLRRQRSVDIGLDPESSSYDKQTDFMDLFGLGSKDERSPSTTVDETSEDGVISATVETEEELSEGPYHRSAESEQRPAQSMSMDDDLDDIMDQFDLEEEDGEAFTSGGERGESVSFAGDDVPSMLRSATGQRRRRLLRMMIISSEILGRPKGLE